MPNRFASGKHAISCCDVCGFQYQLKELKPLTIKTKNTNILACPTCWNPDHPQLMLGTFPVDDPQALRNPRKDNTYIQAGVGVDGYITGGSRDIQWGWNPVGGSRSFDNLLTPNYLALSALIGTVTVTTT